MAVFGFIFPRSSFAQEFLGTQIATNLEVSDSEAQAGDIVSITEDDNLVRAVVAYDQNVFGVVVENPAIELNKKTDKSKAIVSEGEALVKVSTVNGNISLGDFITASKDPGVGQKATQAGVVLGKALASYSGSGVGNISVQINIHYQTQLGGQNADDLWQKLVAFTSTSLQEPNNFQLLLRYLFALILIIISFGLGFISAARAVRTGIVAIGRNPLAKGTIQGSMFLNLLTVLIFTAAGVGLSLLLIFLGR
ncbi:MAG: hypothetical protein WD231_04625 [Candidatus Woykebacteria bacterium]